MTFRTILIAGIVALASTCAYAVQHDHTDHHAGHGSAQTSDSPSTQAYKAANDDMHKDMDIAYTGDADVDFIQGMIPHHQGAVDMAKIVLEHGKNPETRKLAQQIIAAQEKEIAWMKDWLARNAR